MPALSPKRQWDRHLELIDGGAESWAVYARAEDAADDAEWQDVGHVSFDAAAPNASAPSAVQLHKRLIVKHARRLYPLALGRPELALQLGLRVASAADDAEVTPLADGIAAAARETCGFSGKPGGKRRLPFS